MSDVKFIQFQAFMTDNGLVTLFALDSAGVIWRLGNEWVKESDRSAAFPGVTREMWFAQLPHPSSDKRDG